MPDSDREPVHSAPASAPAAAGRVGLGMSLVIGLAAGLIAWGAGEVAERKLVAPSVSEFEVSGNAQFALRGELLTRKSMIGLACLGGALGIGLGVAGALARRVGSGGVLLSALAGLFLGAAAGGGSARLLVPWFVRNEQTMADDMILPMLTHGGMASAVGLAAGLALAVGLGGPPSRLIRTAVGGLAGGALAAAVYEPAGAFLFPLAQTGQPVANSAGARLLALALPAVCIAAVAALAAREARKATGPVTSP